MINKLTGFAVLRCHGKGSSYVNTVLQLCAHVIENV